MKNYLNLAEASQLTQLSERSLRRIAKQLLSEQSSDVRSIKTKTGFRYELSLSYLSIHLSRNFWKFLGVSEIGILFSYFPYRIKIQRTFAALLLDSVTKKIKKMELLFGWIIFSFVVGFVGSGRKIGFFGVFFLSLLLSLLLCSTSTFAQIGGKSIKGAYTSTDGTVFNVGDTVKLSIGTMDNGSFKYIYVPANYIFGIPQLQMKSQVNGLSYVIKDLREIGNKRTGYKTIAVVKTSVNSVNGVIDIESAIASGEIITANNQKNKQQNLQKISVTDELLKLKQLLDAGVITQSEFDEQKKKLFNKY